MIDKVAGAVILTGGTGFLGKHVYNELLHRGYERVFILSRTSKPWVELGFHRGVDLRNYKQVSKLFRSNRQIKNIQAVINLAASVGGIGANQTHSASFMMDTLRIGTNLIEACMHNSSMKAHGKFVQIGTVCSYPKFTPVPFKESSLWDGFPEETNAAYGIAKKTIMELIKNYNIQYKNSFNGINLIPVNLYGPGDNFDLDNSHVIPALIRKFDEAISNSTDVTLWGTGTASREFLYVEDAAHAIVEAMEKYEGNEPVNLGSGKEITIKDLASKIAEKMNFSGQIIFDSTKPDGQPRRCLDTSRALDKFGFKATTDFDQGLNNTIRWYRENKEWLTQ